jgi:SAM-dependent methyltransferase
MRPTQVAALLRRVALPIRRAPFKSAAYWEDRYTSGGNSGDGSFGDLASFKANVLNRFVETASIQSVIEFGCGDGSQLDFASYPAYVGLDVSPKAISMCTERFASDASKTFALYPSAEVKVGIDPYIADAALSLDVMYHLVEDDVFFAYVADLFSAALRWVVIYSSDSDSPRCRPDPAIHVRHRPVRAYIAAHHSAWKLTETVVNAFPDDSPADFYFYERRV